MSDFIPYSKLSKKKKREANKKRRRFWCAISPVTRKAPNPKAYDRKAVKAVGVPDDE